MSSHAGRQGADVVAAERRRAGEGRRLEGAGRVEAANVLAHQPAGDDRQPHLLDQIVRRAVGAQSDVDAARAVTADMVHGEAVTGEWLRAMRHRGARLGDQVEILRRVPADLRMIIEEDAVRQHGIALSNPWPPPTAWVML